MQKLERTSEFCILNSALRSKARMRAFATAICVLMLLIAAVSAQQRRPPAPPKLPPLSYTCAHHPDVHEESSRTGTSASLQSGHVPGRSSRTSG